MPSRTKGSEQELARIRSVIAGLVLAGTISLEAAAERLATSPRTLQRRLSNHGMTFWELVEDNRFKITSALLRETDLKVQEIAARLGYCTPSTFARAFARWTGQSPNAYRKAQTDRLSDAK
ncbi:helix-turn-helix transcriptional regulator [Stappia sp. BW2]|jgi:AraC-like DNA-binding protein|uniref:helix-turn-helix domain-containing protein n=1 Tax=Stappia sp. BW2 TaxID=2592622 RepID=UPI0011DE5D72|nr:helix-turn-helix transcriptional regulator [Stappia sp. BW2]TYC78562.1 helix-turn-helix transcriptional regulator [Stappia sp. BW2]